MITDMVNLGPPLRALPDLKTAVNRRSEEKPAEKDPGSFEQVLSEKTATKLSQGLPEKGKNPVPEKSREGNMEPAKMAASVQKNENKEDSKVDPDTKESVEAKNLGDVGKEVGQKMKLSERQKVMQKFMDSIESEFGIPPEKVVEAMAQLSDKELLQSPEETAPQVIAKLDLNPAESEKAEAMYLAMVTQLSGTLPQVKDPQALQPQAKAFIKDALTGGGAMAAALATRERRQMLNNSLDRMNSSFFMKPEIKLPTEMTPTNAQEMGPERLLNQNYLKPQQLDSQGPSLLDVKSALAQQGIDPKTLSPEAQAKMAELQTQLNAASQEMTTDDLRAALTAIGMTAVAAQTAIKNDPENAKALRMEQALKGEQPAMVAAPVTAGLAIANAQKGQEAGGEHKESDRESTKDFMSVDPGLAAPSKLSAGSDFMVPQATVSQAGSVTPHAMAAGAGMTAAGAMQKSADSDANIQAVMKQAQYMIKKGGGEVTVQMNPEGMGQVHLKVMLNEGKVNLEMKTDNNETKKLLESSLADLKTSLGIHKMAIDHVKVDVSNQLASQNEHQKSQEQASFKQDPQREQARQFFNQFHEDNLARRDGYYETSGVKAYSRGKPVQPLKPGDEAESVKTRRYQGSGKGSGLDLVA